MSADWLTTTATCHAHSAAHTDTCHLQAGAVLTLFYHCLLFLYLSVPSALLNKWMLVIMAVTMIACTALLLPVSVVYRRRLLDAGNEDNAPCCEFLK